MSVTDSISPPGSGPPRHVHGAEDESFVILTGSCTFWIEGRTIESGPGEAVFIPRGREHTFRAMDGAPCRHLIVLTPAGFEGFFAEMAAGQYRIPEDMGAVTAVAERFRLSFTGPPLSADGAPPA